MNLASLLSDHLADLRRTVVAALQPGRAVGYGEALVIAGKLNTAVALAQEIEEENRILEHRLRVGNDALRNRKAAADITDVGTSDNVTAFRPTLPHLTKR
ncbi:hypothetical protein [Shinella pollutisoli]|uniref:Transposase n=1 Tax=Shinella pollutisoli TaxID=2250594 RepID=A0ABV7DJM7_9HYPH|nr:hypothetical protein [Shinella pollutisoli]